MISHDVHARDYRWLLNTVYSMLASNYSQPSKFLAYVYVELTARVHPMGSPFGSQCIVTAHGTAGLPHSLCAAAS